MKNYDLERAKRTLQRVGYRVLREEFEQLPYEEPEAITDGVSVDQEAIEQAFANAGLDYATVSTEYGDIINSLAIKGIEADKIASAINVLTSEEVEPSIDDVNGDEVYSDDGEGYELGESKSRSKSDKFNTKMKNSYKRRKKELEDEDDDDDEDLNEDYESARRKLIDAGAARDDFEGSEVDTDKFNTNFRSKVLLLKKALAPKFVSELIKRNDFEIDADDIKAYAIKIIEHANLDAKDPVQALQKKLKAHFPGVQHSEDEI